MFMCIHVGWNMKLYSLLLYHFPPYGKETCPTRLEEHKKSWWEIAGIVVTYFYREVQVMVLLG